MVIELDSMEEVGTALEQPPDVEDDDDVVQEIKVFLSSIITLETTPNMNDLNTSTTTTNNNNTYKTDHRTYLMQYPGHWNHHPQHPKPPPDGHSPLSIRIKPRHNIMEAEHIVDYHHSSSDNDHHSNDIIPTTTRTYESQTIPMNTHLCFGKYITNLNQSKNAGKNNNGSTELHLIPITHVTQMRPSFQHLTNHPSEEVEEDMEEDEDDHTTKEGKKNHGTMMDQNNQNTATTTTLTYQRKESDRAIAARKSSYAYQKQSQDNEPFIPLQVLSSNTEKNDPETDPHRPEHGNPNQPMSSRLVAPESTSNPIFVTHRDRFVPANQSYIQSLNYSIHPTSFNPTTGSKASISGNPVPSHSNPVVLTSNINNDPTMDIRPNHERKRILSRIMTILQLTNGPIPFSILLLSIQTSETKNDSPGQPQHSNIRSTTTTHPTTVPSTSSILLLSLLNSIAVLVRGNWYIHSKFMKIIPHPSILQSNRKQISSSVSLLKGPPISSSTTSVIIVGSNTNHQQFVYKQSQQRIRTFALLLLHLYGKIYKARFIQAYNSTATATATTNMEDLLTQDDVDHDTKQKLFTIILHQIAKPTKDGYWVGKIQEDTSFPQMFPDTVLPHDCYWNQQQTIRFQKELLFYSTKE